MKIVVELRTDDNTVVDNFEYGNGPYGVPLNIKEEFQSMKVLKKK